MGFLLCPRCGVFYEPHEDELDEGVIMQTRLGSWVCKKCTKQLDIRWKKALKTWIELEKSKFKYPMPIKKELK